MQLEALKLEQQKIFKKLKHFPEFYLVGGTALTLLAEEKYKDEFDFRLFLEEIVYLEDVKTEKTEFLKEKTTKAQLQEFFEKEVKKLRI